MESSTVLAFRIFVMLSCLIIVPMAAIFGSAFPDVVKSVLVDRIVAWSTGKPIESTHASGAPDGFREVTGGAGALAAHDGRGNSQAPRWDAQDRDVASWRAPGAAAPASAVVPLGGAGAAAGFNQSASFSTPTDSRTVYPPVQRIQPAPAESPYHRGANNPQAGAQEPSAATAADSAPPYQGPPPAAPRASGLEQPERFTDMERKLREYGATYYLLETWGNDGQLYRFHCRMAVGNNPNLTRHFEATDRNALEAMSQVLERVEAWRAGRLQ
ncbi:MAG: hypothetical protein WD063_12055 [Pirellulales bacterium]